MSATKETLWRNGNWALIINDTEKLRVLRYYDGGSDIDLIELLVEGKELIELRDLIDEF